VLIKQIIFNVFDGLFFKQLTTSQLKKMNTMNDSPQLADIIFTTQ